MRRFVTLATIVLAALAVVGCGLSDYEKRMDEQRERLHAFDEAFKLLGALVELPYTVDGEKQKQPLLPFEVFFRVPKEISGSFKGVEATYRYANQSLFRYYGPKPDVNVFLAGAKAAEKDAKVPKKDEGALLPEQFREHIRGAVQDYFSRTYNINIQVPDAVRKETKTTLRNGQLRHLDFEVTEFDDGRLQTPSRVAIYYHRWSDRQAALVFQMPKQQADQHWTKTVDVSLKTLEITPVAVNMRREFRP